MKYLLFLSCALSILTGLSAESSVNETQQLNDVIVNREHASYLAGCPCGCSKKKKPSEASEHA